jgi:hypothetical protein
MYVDEVQNDPVDLGFTRLTLHSGTDENSIDLILKD